MLNGPYRSDRSYRGSGSSALARPAAVAARRGKGTDACIAGLATSDSENVLSQAQVLDRLGLAGDEFAEGIFARCGVDRRHLRLDADFLDCTLQDRTDEIERELLRHSIRAVEALALDPKDIGTVISSSLYSLGVPSLAHRLVEHFDMSPTTDKYHITGVACASGVPLIRLAGQTLHASSPDREGEHPDRHTLVVAAESMSSILMRATPHDPKAKTVGSAIFGDGCAAVLVSTDPRAQGPAILASQVHQLGTTLDAVSLNLAGEDSYLHIARDLPELAEAGLPGLVGGFLRANGLERSEVDHWIVHPGGRRIIDNVQSALELSDEQVASSRGVLADHGNIGTPSILYVLEDAIERHEPAAGEHGLMVTIGPGVTVGLMLLGW